MVTDEEFQKFKEDIQKQLTHFIADKIQELKEKAVCKPGEEPLIRVPVAEIEIMGEKIPIVYMLGTSTQWSVSMEIKSEWGPEARDLCTTLIEAYNNALISIDAEIKMTGNYHNLDIKASQIASAYRELSDHVGPIEFKDWQAQVGIDWGEVIDWAWQKFKGLIPMPWIVRLIDIYISVTDRDCDNPPHGPFPPGPVPPRHRLDPLILDLGGDGIETTNLKVGATWFDHNADEFAERTGWVAANDGLLVMDRNGNGTIDDGKELFGDGTILSNGKMASNGFQALTDSDSNGDGRIDANDPIFSQLRVWKDTYSDGLSMPEELHTLNELGIKAINLASTITNVTDSQGNTQNRLGSFQWVDGTTGQIGKYTLQRDTLDTIATDWQDVPDDTAALPDLRGYGNVCNLHQAMVKDVSGQLKTLVEQFVAATDVEQRNSLMEQILFKWTATENIDPTSRGPNIDARELEVLEEMYGTTFVGSNGPNPDYNTSIPINAAYREIFELMYADLMAQTHLKDLYGKISYTQDEETGKVRADFTSLIPDLVATLDSNRSQGEQLLSEFARTLRGGSFCPNDCYMIFREHMIEIDPELGWVFDTGGLPVIDGTGQGIGYWTHINGTDNADAIIGSLTEGGGVINGQYGDDVIYGTDLNEQIFSMDGNSLLVAGGGNDRIWAGEGNDILDGGTCPYRNNRRRQFLKPGSVASAPSADRISWLFEPPILRLTGRLGLSYPPRGVLSGSKPNHHEVQR